jgi:hypothetical protein
MKEVVDWIGENALAVVLGSLLFVVGLGIVVWASRHNKDQKIKHDSEDGFPG